MCSSAASSAILVASIPPILTRLPRSLTLASSALTRAASRSASGVRTRTYECGRSGGGAGMSSPSIRRVRYRLAPPSFLSAGAEPAQKMPLCSVTRLNTKAPTASGKLMTA